MTQNNAIDVLYSPVFLTGSSDILATPGCVERPEALLRRMDANRVSQVLLAACKQWGCERHWQCSEVQTDDITQYVQMNKERFAGMASYNPYSITESLLRVRRAIQLLDIRGVYVQTEGSPIALSDRRMYPLYSRCVELGAPVLLQVGERPGLAHPSELNIVAMDFPELEIVAGWTGPLDFEIIAALAAKSASVFFAFSASEPAQDARTAELLRSPIGQRCMWGSNGLPWRELLDHVCQLGLSEPMLNSFLHDVAARMFKFSRPALPLLGSDEGEGIPLAE